MPRFRNHSRHSFSLGRNFLACLVVAGALGLVALHADALHRKTPRFIQITDRAKDVIKSGGEWISSIEIENIAVGHPDVAVAAVIGRPHPKWDERPLLLIEPIAGRSPTEQDLLAFLEGKIAKWWMPDAVLVIDQVPLGSTGKIDKKELRAMADRGAFEPGA